MNPNANPLNTDTHRQCTMCREVKELVHGNFYRAKGLRHGLAYTCVPCELSRVRVSKKRTMTPEKRKIAKEYQVNYRRSNRGRAHHKMNCYKKIDKRKGRVNDLTPEWVQENITDMPCIYCGQLPGATGSGCDRLDNSKGHTKDNVVPCCGDCNCARGDAFTHEEMRVIGAAIRLVKAARKANVTP